MKLAQWILIMTYEDNEILTLKEVAQALRLDPRTVKEVAFALDSVVKLKVCYNLLTYNEVRSYGGTSEA